MNRNRWLKGLLPAAGILLVAAAVSACSGAEKPGPAPSQPPQATATAKPEYDAAYGRQYAKLWAISERGPAIPGLAGGVVPQGLAYWPEKDWLIVSSYEDGDPSTLDVVEATSGKAVKQVSLLQEGGAPYTGHAGGVTVTHGHLWVASGGSAYRIPLADLVAAPDKGKLKFTGSFSTPTRASFNAFADGILWVGEFYNYPDYDTDDSHQLMNNVRGQYNAWAAGYKLDPGTDLPTDASGAGAVTPDYILSLPDRIQGMAVTPDSIILSQSYGRTKDSALLKYARPDLAGAPHTTVKVSGKEVPVWFLDPSNQAKENGSLAAPPMTEGVVPVGDRLYVLFESGSTKYRSSALSPMDHMRVIRLPEWK